MVLLRALVCVPFTAIALAPTLSPNHTQNSEVVLPAGSTLPPRIIPRDHDEWLPFLSVLGAWVCFGSLAVPMKSQAVLDAGVHPVVYQCHKTFWAFASSFMVLFFQPFEFTWWGIASGFSWVPAGIAAVVAVQNIGIACGQATWQVVIILMSFMWSELVLKDETLYNVWGTASSLMALVFGAVGMTVAFNMQPADPLASIPCKGGDSVAPGAGLSETSPLMARMQSAPASLVHGLWGKRRSSFRHSFALPGLAVRTSKSEGRLVGRRDSAPNRMVPEVFSSSDDDGGLDDAEQPSYLLGLGAAVFNGVWGGASLVPSHFSEIQGVHYVISFGIGALVAMAVVLPAFLVYRMMNREPLPPFHFRVMALPGFISGTLFTMGNFCALYAVSTLGQGVGYSLVQASVIVSGLWGILYYREMAGQAISYWVLASALCGVGVLGLALERVP